jgi:hypothetical protein
MVAIGETSKSKTLLFAGSVSKKEQAEPALSWERATQHQGQADFS